MGRRAPLVLAVVTSPMGVLLVHRLGQTPPVMFPGARAEPGEQPRSTAQRGVLDDARIRVRAGRVMGRQVLEDGRPAVYVAAQPLDHVTEDAVAMSLQVGWYFLDQVDMLLPDLWSPVRRHLEGTIPRR